MTSRTARFLVTFAAIASLWVPTFADDPEHDSARSFSFELDRIVNWTAFFRGAEGCVWNSASYACGDCRFAVSYDAISGADSALLRDTPPAMLFRLTPEQDRLEVTCLTIACSIRGVDAEGAYVSVDMSHQEKVTIGAHPGTRFTAIGTVDEALLGARP